MTTPTREFRNALGRFATGVCLISTQIPGQEPLALIANSFASVSLDPPLVLFSIDRKSDRFWPFMQAQVFAINVLADRHQAISNSFSKQGAGGFAGTPYMTLVTGAPVLEDALAAFDCELFARYEGGDHVILVGKVLAQREAEGQPLLYHRGKYAAVAGGA